MSDWLQFVVDERVTADDAETRAAQLRGELVAAGWILASADAACVLAAKGHRPGTQVSSWYARGEGASDFTTLLTNGVTIATGPFTNLAAAPFETDLLTCPHRRAAVDQEQLMERAIQWMSGETDAGVTCGACGKKEHIRSLRTPDESGPPIVCGQLSLTFCNWPPLDDPGWNKSVIDVIAETLGARPSVSWAKL